MHRTGVARCVSSTFVHIGPPSVVETAPGAQVMSTHLGK
jgi:hypothetical protein